MGKPWTNHIENALEFEGLRAPDQRVDGHVTAEVNKRVAHHAVLVLPGVTYKGANDHHEHKVYSMDMYIEHEVGSEATPQYKSVSCSIND